MTRLRIYLSFVLIACLSACISLGGGGNQKPAQLYTLTAAKVTDDGESPAAWTLLVEPITADASLNTSRIALKKSPLTVDYFAEANWADEAPRMLQRLLVESFENSKKIPKVSGDALLIRADYSLKVELRDFQAEYPEGNVNNPPVIHVRYSVKMVKMPQRSVLAGETFEVQVPAAGNTLETITQAYNQANSQAISNIIAWTRKAGNGAMPSRSRK